MAKKGKKMPSETSGLLFDGQQDFMTKIIAKSHEAVVKKKSKPKASNDLTDILGDSTLEIIDDPTKVNKGKTIEWSQIKSRRYSTRQPVELWQHTTFFAYFKQLCAQKNDVYKDQIEMQIGIAVRARFILNLRKNFEEINEKPVSNSALRDYINYFVKQELDAIVAANNKFSVYDLYSKRIIRRYLKSSVNTTNASDQSVDESAVKIDIDFIYSTGGTNLLNTYGLVIPYYWLINKKNLTETEAKNVIHRFYMDAKNEGDLVEKSIRETTKKLSPYTLKFENENIHALLREFNLNTISFSSTGKDYL